MALKIPSGGALLELVCRGVSGFLLCYVGTLLGIAVPGPGLFRQSFTELLLSELSVREVREQIKKRRTLALTSTRLITTLTSPDYL